MAHEQDPDIGKLVYDGQYSEACLLAQERYEADPGKLVMYASTLYSSRRAFNVDDEMGPLIPLLIQEVARAADAKNADHLDDISTYLCWWGKRTKTLDSGIGQVALEAANLGLELTETTAPTEHSRSFLLLTSAELNFMGGHCRLGAQQLRLVGDIAWCVTDHVQLARIYKKLAYLSLRYRYNPFAMGWWFYKWKELWLFRKQPPMKGWSLNPE